MYGSVTSEQLTKEEEKVKTFFWHPNDPPDILFNLVENLILLAKATKLAKTEDQAINYALGLVRKTGEYKRALIKWYNLPDTDRTWVRFKTHLTAAQQQLKQVCGSTMTNSTFHQAN